MRFIMQTENKTLASANSWISLARSAIWIIGLVAVLSMKINSIDNTNNLQDAQIAKTQEELRVLKGNIEAIKDKQVDQLVMLTKLVTIAEQAQMMDNRKKKVEP